MIAIAKAGWVQVKAPEELCIGDRVRPSTKRHVLDNTGCPFVEGVVVYVKLGRDNLHGYNVRVSKQDNEGFNWNFNHEGLEVYR